MGGLGGLGGFGGFWWVLGFFLGGVWGEVYGQLAEVEIGRSRTDGVRSVSSFSLSCFFFCLSFYFSFLFLVLTHLSHHFVFVLFLFSSRKT